jgi:hypothetical protein
MGLLLPIQKNQINQSTDKRPAAAASSASSSSSASSIT